MNMYRIIKDNLPVGAKRMPKGTGPRRVTVKCDVCGWETTILYASYRDSCGRCKCCEAAASSNRSALGDAQSKGVKGAPEWNSWHCMHQRCRDPKSPNRKYYYDRGIKVCERWSGRDGYKNFISDMGRKPSPEYTLDRIDVNGDYEPDNCRWADKKQQTMNRRKSIIIEENGIKDTAGGWGRRLGLASSTIIAHAKMGVPLGAVLYNRGRGWRGDEVEGVDYYVKPYGSKPLL